MAWRLRGFGGLMLMLVVACPSAAPAKGEGHSLFQEVFTTTDGRSAIPFPFPALLDRLRQELAPDGTTLRGGLPLIVFPLGRSLQRHAAEPDGYFAYPRVVVAVTGEPRPGAPLLKDRLYVGYHELLGVLEVISYNETAGRFEFQLVRDYRPGATPRLVQARRELCLACHHDGTPIFSRQSWDETAANPAVARLLESDLSPSLRTLPWRGGVDVPNAIDDATERANRLILAQRLWREGCGGEGEAARVCRGELLMTAVVQRLGLPRPETKDPQASARLAPALGRWPGGLALPNPDIADRLPLASLDPVSQRHPSPVQLQRLADVAAAFDPLALRPARERWDGGQPGAGEEAAVAVGLFLAAPDVAAVDQALARSAAPEREQDATGCRMSEFPSSGDGRALRVACTSPRFGARLIWRGRRVEGTVDAPEPQSARGRAWPAGQGGRLTLDVGSRRLRAFTVEWAGGDAPPRVTLRLRDEMAVLRGAVADLAAEGDALGSAPLDRRVVVPALLRRLGVGQGACCRRAGPFAPPPVEASRPIPAGLGAEMGALFRNCGQCHDSADHFPPPFLGGQVAGLASRVAACAPRMVYRLAMGTVAEGQRSKTPMPPPASAHGPGFARSADHAILIPWLESLAGSRTDALLQRSYADLPPCRPAPD